MVNSSEDIAIVGWAQTPAYERYLDSEPTLIMDVVNAIIGDAEIDRSDIDFTIAGSCDYLSGMPFAFVMNIDGVGAWPPVYESHVEMDGAWALFEAWIRLQVGDIDVALAMGSGKSSPGNHQAVFALQNDPYVMAPLGLDPHSLAAIQARQLIEAGRISEAGMAETVRARHGAAAKNTNSLVGGDTDVETLLSVDPVLSPLRPHDLPAIADGAAAVLLARGDKARELSDNPIWISGIDHRIESHHPGLRDLTQSPSTRLAAESLGIADKGVDVAELMACYSHQEVILSDAMSLGDNVDISPSGGALTAHPVMATGLVRVIEVAQRIADGDAGRGVAHATSGSVLQQNLLCMLEGRN